MSTPVRILLVEDNPDDIALTERCLRQEFTDIQVSAISDGAALSAAEPVQLEGGSASPPETSAVAAVTGAEQAATPSLQPAAALGLNLQAPLSQERKLRGRRHRPEDTRATCSRPNCRIDPLSRRQRTPLRPARPACRIHLPPPGAV